jgi:NADPH:quinone reductase-like Zn-dependent oxidoreductase
MRAWCFRRYGGPEVLSFEELPVPLVAPREILVKVAAASINPIDSKLREGKLSWLVSPEFPRVPGRDCAGTAVAIGAGVSDFALGDLVVGIADMQRNGTHAEFAILPAAQVAKIPPAMSAVQAVAVGVTGLSAYIPLMEIARPSPGQRVLVHAGAGGVGSLAVQIARHLGAEVVATCGTANLDYVRSLGAALAIDYTVEDFVIAAGRCDVVFDTIGGEVHRRSSTVLRPGGMLVYLTAAPIDAEPPRDDIRIIHAKIRYTREVLEQVIALIASGAVVPQVGRIFPLSEAQAAYAISATGHARGKIILVTD